jgi:hypothetical protein
MAAFLYFEISAGMVRKYRHSLIELWNYASTEVFLTGEKLIFWEG